MNYPCGGCGASVEYAAGTTALRCPYCGHEQQLVATGRQVREHAFAELPQKPLTSLSAHVLVCEKCGARTESDALSERCQFCGAALVADTSAGDQIAPEAVLPFELDRDSVRAALRKWVSSRWFAPSRLKKVTEAESLRGTYLPHWTFDARTTSDYTGERGDYYYETETYTETVNGKSESRTRQVRKTRWRSASGEVQRDFDDVLVPATQHVSSEQLDKLTPWPLVQAVPFQPDYLAGYQTLRYDLEPGSGLAEAKSRMAPVINDDCRSDIGGDEQRVHSVDTRYFDIMFKLMLLPVWIVGYLYAGRTFQVLVNARTGEVLGQRPWSVVKIVAAALVAVAVVVAIILAFTLRS
jgi:DNA-directed RNA polymerase subunit RPC12/RpoP